MVESRSNKIKSRPKMSSVDRPTGRFDSVLKYCKLQYIELLACMTIGNSN